MRRISNFEFRISKSWPVVTARLDAPFSKFEIRNSKFTIRIISFAIITALLLACAPRLITRDKWQQMSPADKAIYVSTLIGEEKAKQRKGGTGRTYSAPPEVYVTRIDAAYAQGDRRDPRAIFQEMADTK